MWGLSPAASPFGAPQGFWSLLSRVMGMIVLSLEQLLQLWISKPAALSDFPQPRRHPLLCSSAALPQDQESSQGSLRTQGHWEDQQQSQNQWFTACLPRAVG